ncbi:hypothetical protein ACX80Z_15855 [Arthrobacter sp. TMT4-20]
MTDPEDKPALISAANYAKLFGVDKQLLEILLDDGYIRGSVEQGRRMLIPSSEAMSNNQLRALGRVAYEESLNALSTAIMKLQSLLTRTMAEVEDALNGGIKPVRELGSHIIGLDHNRHRSTAFQQLERDMEGAQWAVVKYQRVLWSLDEADRIHERNYDRAAKYLD